MGASVHPNECQILGRHLFAFTPRRARLGCCRRMAPVQINLKYNIYSATVSLNNLNLKGKRKKQKNNSPNHLKIPHMLYKLLHYPPLATRTFFPPAGSYPQHNQNRYVRGTRNPMQLFHPAREVISRALSRPGFKGMLSRVT